MNPVKITQQTLQRFPKDRFAPLSADAIMRHVCYALLPGILLQALFFGTGVIIQVLLAVITATVSELIYALMRKRFINRLDISAAFVTALLLAASLPATAPWWLIIIGTFLGLALGKQVFGGMGMNIFNPAIVGFCIVYLSFPAEMSNWPQYYIDYQDSLDSIFSQTALDGLVGATQLADIKANGNTQLAGNTHWWLNLAWLTGGAYLWLRRVADWRLSLTFILTFFILTGALSPLTLTAVSITEHLGLGALFFTACFIVTDPTTAATSAKGRLVYAILTATLAVIIRQYSNMPDSMAFAILLGNLCVPMLDHYTKPEYQKG